MKFAISRAADVLLGGGVIAYPTEGVYGLGCMPDDAEAVSRVLRIKNRHPGKGLILIASEKSQLDDWIDPDGRQIPDPDPSHPTTWVIMAKPHVLSLVRGDHQTLAVRLTTNPTAAAICDAVASPIISTSANLVGKPVARNRYSLHRRFEGCVDYIVPGDCGPASGPSEIRDLRTGKVLRPHTT
ncbi:MAG: L-threonylcarbamoyladenylate synthase [Gammaproteobacteria bacterium]|nr:L-threonylcarbamoyladenylate synthase [Gammaproteobacteria bacterium]MDH3749923.1 L-threonylcarbamoyladenylate synthase [Gammaproteobacteria bacterium]MDH3804944.1 L-threonylcarbamoyladenylate synthase [Gammaproteobacteria bacterium]